MVPKSIEIEVWGGLGGSGAPWEHLGATMAAKIAKRSPKRRQDGQHGAKMGQDAEAAKSSQDGDLGSPCWELS